MSKGVVLWQQKRIKNIRTNIISASQLYRDELVDEVFLYVIIIVGAHTIERPKESYPGYWNSEEDIKAILNLIKDGCLNFKDMICEIHSPADACEVYTRLINEKAFPVGVLFDWGNI